MEKEHILKKIAALEKERSKLLRNFQKIADKADDNDFLEKERIDVILDLINHFDRKIKEFKALIKEH
jgi:hypothetical protein